MPHDDAGDLVSTFVAAHEVGISPRTLQRYVASGAVHPTLVLPSGRYRWKVDELTEHLADHHAPPERPDPKP